MKNWISEFLYLPAGNGKLEDKIFHKKIACSVLLILLLLMGMSLTAAAYFTSDVVAHSNMIQAAKYELAMEVAEIGAEGNTPVTLENGIFTISAGKKYAITLKYAESSAETGFCAFQVAGRDFHTVQIGADAKADGGRRDTLVFTMDVRGEQGATAAVKMMSHWGTSSYYSLYQDADPDGPFFITENETLELSLTANGLADPLTEGKAGEEQGAEEQSSREEQTGDEQTSEPEALPQEPLDEVAPPDTTTPETTVDTTSPETTTDITTGTAPEITVPETSAETTAPETSTETTVPEPSADTAVSETVPETTPETVPETPVV